VIILIKKMLSDIFWHKWAFMQLNVQSLQCTVATDFRPSGRFCRIFVRFYEWMYYQNWTVRLNNCVGVCMHREPQKNVPPHFCPYLRQILTYFQNSFTGTLLRLLNIPPQLNCVAILLCEIKLFKNRYSQNTDMQKRIFWNNFLLMFLMKLNFV